MNSHSDNMESLGTYLRVWLALLLLLGLTLGSAYIPMGHLNIVANLAVALAKMLLVMVFFMHLRTSNPLLRIFAGVGFAWLLLLILLSLADYLTRVTVPSPW